MKLSFNFFYDKFIVKSMLVIIGNHQGECGVFSLVRDILQWNVAGLPLIHQVSPILWAKVEKKMLLWSNNIKWKHN